MLLRPEDRLKLDTTNDLNFYDYPRFVTHVDEQFINQLTTLYRQKLQPNTRILDLMSSWISHLPDEINFSHVEGHGMNEEELRKNHRLDHYFIQDLNQNPQLLFNNEEFDAVLITVSVQYLQYPEAVFHEICRILKPQGIVIVSFSNRMFYQKAIAIWREGNDRTRLSLVKKYFTSVKGFTNIETLVSPPQTPSWLQFLGLGNSDPFYAVIAQKEKAK